MKDFEEFVPNNYSIEQLHKDISKMEKKLVFPVRIYAKEMHLCLAKNCFQLIIVVV